MRKHGRKDANHNALTEHAEAFGASVVDLSPMGDGIPDCLIGYRGHTWLIEFKSGNGALTDDQATFISLWRGSPVHVLRTVEDVERLLRTVVPNKRQPRKPLDLTVEQA